MTTEERAERVAELVETALERAPAGRAAFLRGTCADDAALRAEVESLLGHLDGARDFLETPLVQFRAGALLDGESGGNDAAGESRGRFQPGETLGDCRIVSLLGEGGMGEVYLAEDTALGRQVAVKVVRHGLLGAGSLLRHFRQEERILARLTHPHIARLYGGAVTPEGLPYFVMECVAGERLDDYCRARRLPTEERLQLFRKVCAAVAYAHQHLVIHRDLKPANIRVTPEGEPKLLDFGIAKLLDPEPTVSGAEPRTLTLTLQGVMTPEYASPEQLRGERLSTASDLYSLGVILYELLTGQRPYRFKSRRPEEIARAVCEEETERPSTAAARARPTDAGEHPRAEPPDKLRRRLAGDLDNIVLMALRKEPARRYASAAQLGEDLRRHLDGLPVLARRDTWRYVGGKFIRRHKAAVAAGALALCALLSAVVVSAQQARVARQERDRALLAQAQAERLNAFLQNLLGSANPDTLGRDVKVVEVLAAAAKDLDRELAGQPELLVQAHGTIARAYANLREAEPAELHARAALALARRVHGNLHPATAHEAAFLGRALRIFRRFGEAEPLLREALATKRRHPEADPGELPATLQNLAAVLGSTGRPREAAPLLEEALARARAISGEASVETAVVWNELGNLRVTLEDLPGGEAAFQKSIAIYNNLTPVRFASVNPRLNLHDLFLRQGRGPESLAMLREAEIVCRQTVGENNPTFGYILGRFAVLDFLNGDPAAAAPKLRRCLETVGVVYPKDDADMVLARALLGLSLTRAGQPAAGEPFLREALADGKAIPRGSLALLGNLEGALGECLLGQGRSAEAAPLLRASLQELTARLGENDARTVAARVAAQRLGGGE